MLLNLCWRLMIDTSIQWKKTNRTKYMFKGKRKRLSKLWVYDSDFPDTFLSLLRNHPFSFFSLFVFPRIPKHQEEMTSGNTSCFIQLTVYPFLNYKKKTIIFISDLEIHICPTIYFRHNYELNYYVTHKDEKDLLNMSEYFWIFWHPPKNKQKNIIHKSTTYIEKKQRNFSQLWFCKYH